MERWRITKGSETYTVFDLDASERQQLELRGWSIRPQVEVVDRGRYLEGHVLWLTIDAEPAAARLIAEGYGIVTEADVTEDGRQSFAVLEHENDELTGPTGLRP